MYKRALIALTLFVCAATSASAQATFDARTFAARTWTAGAPVATALAHTTAVGTNRLLIVGVHLNLDVPTGASVSGVTYGGQALTQLAFVSDANPETRTEVWYLLSPPTGANNVLVTAAGMGGSTLRGVVSATTYSNADQTAPTFATAFADSGTASVTIPAAATTDTILDFVTARETTTLTDGAAPQTQQYNLNSGGTSNDDIQAGSSDRAAATPNTTMTWTVNAARRWSQIAVNIRHARADVEVTQRALNDPVVPGGTLTYSFTIRNNGPSAATVVTLTDTIPAATSFVSSSTTQGSCSGSPAVTCTIGTMTSGQTVTVTIQVLAPLTGGLIAVNTGTVTTTSVDPVTPNTASATAFVLVQAAVCGTPGDDGAGGTLAGVDNSYWQGNSSPAAGATSLTVTGARRGNPLDITDGDLVLIIQMQDAAIDSNNDDRYGNGLGVTGGTTGTGSGYTNANNVGRYEYVRATSTVNAGPGVQTLNFSGSGAGNGLMYAYTNAAATATQGQRRYQIVRVPQWSTATLGATLTASSWNGLTGGILAVDVAGDLALGGIIVNVNGLGFRGGAGIARNGGAGANTDYRSVIANDNNGYKGEGIAGTPAQVLDNGANTPVGVQGYPNGDFGRGAPGNAGGGGNDAQPSVNDRNAGGGGGANWGSGGKGGNSWQTNEPTGGFGGSPFYDSPGRVVMGGGGGAGSRNDSATIASAGGAGGGLVLIRAGSLSGTGTITAHGAAAYNLTANDGGGGGGGGGSIVVLSYAGGLAGLTVSANGARGGDAWSTQAPGGMPGERHGPGGGGGGGYIATNGTINVASAVTAGASGITTNVSDTFGAQPGTPGTIVQNASFNEITGIRTACTDISVASSDSPDPVFAGNNLTFTQSVTNNSATVPAQSVTLTQTTPPGTTFVSMTTPVGWSCSTPTVGNTGTVTCTKTTALAAGTNSGNFTFVVATSPSLANGSTITQPVSTSTINPELNTANNSASTTTTVQRRVDVAVTKVSNDDGSDFVQGETLIYTVTVTNNGPSRATNVVVTDPLPAGFAFTSVVPGGPTCTFASNTVTCTYATLDPGVTNNIVITGTVTVNTTQLVNTATSTRTETDTNAANNSATVTVSVLAPTVVNMLSMSAVEDRKGKVSITWTTSYENEHLGFNVYRQTSGGRVKINKHLIAGGALFSKGSELTSGRGYRWKDKLKDGQFAQYYIEDVDIHGVRTLHGPVSPNIATAELVDEANTDTLADLGTTSDGIFLSPRGLGTPKYPSETRTKKQLSQQWDLASQPAVKLMVTEEGWYRVTKGELTAAGFDTGTDPRRLALFTAGIEQPVGVNDGGDGRLDDADTIEFYGTGTDTLGTGARAYWVVKDKGTTMRVRSDKSKGSRVATSTPHTFQRIERVVFFSALVNNGEKGNFFGTVLGNWGATQDLTVENLNPAGAPASLEIVLQGVTEVPHILRLTLNGQDLGTANLDNMQRLVKTISIPAASLVNGTNTLGLTALGGDEDILVIESIRLTYAHLLIADGDALKVLASSGTSITASGFTSSRVRAFDVTDAADPMELSVDVTPAGGTFSASTVAPSNGTRTVVLVGESRVHAPAQIVLSRASTWNDTKNRADLVIIAARAFTPAAAPLEARRESEGLETVVVDVQDLYDEFGYGERGAEAVRSFLQRTKEWKRQPRYAILLGDASFDPRNYLGLGAYDYVPTRLVPTVYMKTASDDWLADFNGTGIPQIAIGRLPARTLDDANLMIRRIVERGTGSDANGAWSKQVSFVTDQSTDYDFTAAATALQARVPATMTSTIVSAGTTPNLGAAINSSFDSRLLTYVGHGSVELWSAGSYTGGNAAQLTNGAKLPIVAAMTCLNGYYQDVFTVSMAESLLTNPNGGAIAVWASSTLTEPDKQMEMANELFRQLFGGATLGDSVLKAKAATKDLDVRRSWILFGDPTMKLQ